MTPEHDVPQRDPARRDPAQRSRALERFTVRLTAGGVVALVGTAVFALVLVLVRTRWHPLQTIDLDVAEDLNDAFGPRPQLVRIWRAITTVGQPFTFQVAAVVTAAALWRVGRRRVALFAVVTVLGAGLLSTAVKLLVHRARPTVEVSLGHAAGSSFPSGHALTSFVALGVLVTLVRPARAGSRIGLAAAATAVVLLVGLSRLALGVHYLSDVLGGWLLGLIWLLLMIQIFRLSSRDTPVRPPARL